MSKFKPISKRIVIKDNSISEFAQLSRLASAMSYALDDNGKPFYLYITNDAGEIRSKAQNSLLWGTYYPALAEELKEECIDNISSRCKRKFGIPLMRKQAFPDKPTKKSQEIKKELLRFGLIPHDEQTIADGWITVFEINNFTYEAQIEMYKNMDCTKNFTKKLFCEYLRNIEIWSAKEHGLVLESINETKRREAFS